jgi:hypothetical protein
MSRSLLLALLLAAACKHSSSASSSSHSETSTVTDTTSSETGAVTTTTTVTEQPGETTTTTEEFLPPEKETAPEEAVSEPARLPGAAPDPSGTTKLPRHGPLVKRTVTVTKSGGETTQTTQEATREAQGATETHATAKVDAKAQEAEKGSPALSCAFGGWLAIAGVVAALFGLGYFALKRLRSPV